MKILMVCDHYPLSPRVKKVKKSIEELNDNYVVRVCAWNRENKSVKEDYVIPFNQGLRYGNKLAKLFNLPKFARFVRTTVLEFEPDYLHAIDAEMLLVATITQSNQDIIYEVYDIKNFKNRVLNWFREKIEIFLIQKKVKKIILASTFFAEYYEEIGIDEVPMYVLNNKPLRGILNYTNSGYMHEYLGLLRDKTVVGFVGTVRYFHTLLNLIYACSEIEDTVVLLAGDGPHYEITKQEVERRGLCHKVIMTGRYSAKDLPYIYEACDYIWAAYPNKDLNVRYAISNKFFESRVFEKPVIVSQSTFLGDYTEENQLGVTVDPYDVENIRTVLNELKKGRTFSVLSSSGLYWEDEAHILQHVYK